MKTCPECKIEKELSGFYKHPLTKDGCFVKCKVCVNESKKRYRKTKAGKEAEKRGQKKYGQTKKGKETHRKGNVKYRQTQGGKEMRRKSQQKYNQTYREKRRAHAAVAYALSTGVLTRPDHCEMCFKECEPEGHHDDYAKPLEVKWLCTKCHSKQGVKV